MRFFYLSKELYAPTYYFKVNGAKVELVSKWCLPIGYGGARIEITDADSVANMLEAEIGRSAREMTCADFEIYSTTNARG